MKTKIIGAVAILAILAGCGSDSTSEPTGTETASDQTTVADGSAVESTVPGTAPLDTSPVDTAPQDDLRIVSLSATHTEIMYAIGAGDQLVAVDDQSNYPAEALELPHDLSGFEPNIEAIAALDPDLVLIGGDFNGVGDQLGELGIESWDGPAASTLDDTYSQIEQLGAATGHVAEAAELVLQMQTDIDRIVSEVVPPAEPLTIYHEVDNTFYSADSSTFIGEIYTMAGLRNIADLIESDAGGYPQLNAEFIVSADPNIIFLADTQYSGETPESVAARDGWSEISAVENGNIVALDDDISSRWGPRVVELLQTIVEASNNAVVPT